MVPVIVQGIGNWLDHFHQTLGTWETLLCDLRSAYFRQDQDQIQALCGSIESAKEMMIQSKSDRESILSQAKEQGFDVANFRELSKLLDGQWPALWTHRLSGLEHQVARIGQLGVSLWIHSCESRELVSELMQLLGTKSPQVVDETHKKGDATDEHDPVIIPFPRKAA